MVYLDNAATSSYSEIDDIIVETMANAMKRYWMNPSSLYANEVKLVINKCREQVAKFIGAKSEEIYFTSGGSESNNWAIQGFVNQCFSKGEKPCVITSTIEHKSIMECVSNLNYAAVRYVNVDKDGLVDIKDLGNMVFGKTLCGYKTLASIQFANNEIGAIQDIKKIAEEVHRCKGILHVDAVQAFGHIPIDVNELGIDMMSVSGHKISPVLKGIGFLYKRNGIDIQPLIYGSQEGGLRGGTENVFGIIGLSKALEKCNIGTQKTLESCNKRDYFVQSLKSKFSKSGFDIKLNGHPTQRLPNNINITFPQNITGESLLYTLEISDIYVSTGSACNSKTIEPSYVLKAIGLTDEETMKTVRFTLSTDITYQEIDYVVDEIDKTIKLIEI